MLIDRDKIMMDAKYDLLQHIIMEGLVKALDEQSLKHFSSNVWQKKQQINIKLIVEDVELNVENFINLWQRQVERMIHENAVDLIKDKLYVIDDIIQTTREKCENLFNK